MAQNIKPTAKKTRSQLVDRSSQLKRVDTAKIYEVGLYDIDSAVKYYIDNVIQPRIKDHNDTSIQLPVVYGSPEKWKSVQKIQYLLD